MKVKIFADRSGKILATYRPASGGKDAPSNMRVEVDGGQAHELEVHDALLAANSIQKLHTEYRLDLTGATPKLIRTN